MTTFLKGDTTAEITLALAGGYDYSGKTVHLEYQGARRTFTGCVAGGALSFSFTAEETASMSLGAYPVRAWIEGGGEVLTVHNADVKLRVTDCIADVHGGGAIYLDVHGGLHGIEGLPDRFTEEDLRNKVNEIVQRLGGVVAMAMLALFPVFGSTVEVHTAPKGVIYNDQKVVTNVTLDVSDKADKTNTYTRAETDAKTARMRDALDLGVRGRPTAENGGVFILDGDMRYAFKHRIVGGVGYWRSTHYTYVIGIGEQGAGYILYEQHPTLLGGGNGLEEICAFDLTQGGYYAASFKDDGVTHEIVGYTSAIATVDDIPDAPDLSGYATHSDTTNAAESVVAPVSAAVGTVWSLVYGQTAWFAVTNYMRTVDGIVPSMRLYEVRNGSTNLVYSTEEEIDAKLAAFRSVVEAMIAGLGASLSNRIASVEANMPDKAWSRYQSATGADAPEGVTVVSTPVTMISGGYEWQRYVDVGSNSVWLLQARGVTTLGADTNQFFKITDDDGNVQFEVRKTDSKLVGAYMRDVSFDAGNFRVSCPINVQPTISTAPDLTGPWSIEGDDPNITVTWAHEAGLYTATVAQTVKSNRLFVKAAYLREGGTAIISHAPQRIDGGLMTSGGQVIRPSVSGSTVSWEVVR